MPEDNSKSFVEHVRTIHFALLITSTALIITMMNNQSSVVREAAAELKNAEAAFDLLKPGAARQLVKDALALNGQPIPDFKATETVRLRATPKDKAPVEFLVSFKMIDFSENINKLIGREEPEDDDTDESGGFEVEHGDTLKNFEDRWELINPRRNASEAYLASTSFALAGYVVNRKATANSPHLVLTAKDVDQATPVDVDILAREPEVAALTLDVKSGKRLFEYPASELGDRDVELATMSADGKHLIFLKPPPGQRASRRDAYEAFIWETGKPKPEPSWTMQLGRNLFKPHIAIGNGGSPVAVTVRDLPRRNNVSTPKYSIRIFQGGAATPSNAFLDLLGKAPLAFGGPANDLLSAEEMGCCVLLARTQPVGQTNDPMKLMPNVVAQELRLTADGRRIVVLGNERFQNSRRGGVWLSEIEVEGNIPLQLFEQEITFPSASFSRNGETLAVALQYQSKQDNKSKFKLYCWQLRAGQWAKLLERDLPGKAAVACSPSGDSIAVALRDKLLILGGQDFSSESTIPITGLEIDSLGFSDSDGALTCLLGRRSEGDSGAVVHISHSELGRKLFVAADAGSLANGKEETESFLLLRFADDKKGRAASRIQQLELQSYVREKVPGARWRNGSFKTSFPSLAVVTEQYRDLPVDQIRNIIESEISRSGETVEAFGLKIPAGALRQWGTLVILTLQLYFSRHLRFMRRIHLPQIKNSVSAWIGLYDDQPSRYGTVLSVVVLPVLACVVLVGLAGMRDFEVNRLTWWTSSIGVASILLSMYLGFLTNRELRRLWVELRS